MDSGLTVEQQKLLANELRQKILHTIAGEAKTAKQVAVILGASVGNAHYHLQRLVEGELVAVDETDDEKRYRALQSPSLEPLSHAGEEWLSLEETLWLSIAETGQLVNELRALFYRWQGEFQQPKGRSQPLTVSINLKRRPTN